MNDVYIAYDNWKDSYGEWFTFSLCFYDLGGGSLWFRSHSKWHTQEEAETTANFICKQYIKEIKSNE